MCLLHGVSLRVGCVECCTTTEGCVCLFLLEISRFYVVEQVTLLWMNGIVRLRLEG